MDLELKIQNGVHVTVTQALRACAQRMRDSEKAKLQRRTETTQRGLVTFGVELEFLASRAPGVLTEYHPDNIALQAWKKLPAKERILHLMDWRDEALRTNRGREVRLLRMGAENTHPDLELPSEMTIEPNGVLEMRKHPLASCAEVATFLASIVERVGVPQAQAHLVFPLAEMGDFARISLAQSDRAHFAKLGLDSATGTLPAASFTSSFLPPIDSASARRLKHVADWISNKEELGDTLKYLCAPVLRPGKLYGLHGYAGIEVRQWDIPTGPESAQPELLIALVEDTYELEEWLETRQLPCSLSAWYKTPPASEISTWERVRSFGSLPTLETWTSVLDAMEFALVRRNAHAQKANPRCQFLFPLRAFDCAFPLLANRILTAQKAYVSQLVEWEKSLEGRQAGDYETRTSIETMLAPLRTAVAQFGKASGLAAIAFDEVFRRPPLFKG